MAEYSNREDIDKLLQIVEDLKYFTKFDEKQQLATTTELDAIATELHELYYDKSVIDDIIMNGEFVPVEVTVTYLDESTETFNVLVEYDQYSVEEFKIVEDNVASTINLLVENNVQSRRYNRNEVSVVELVITYMDESERTVRLLVV